MADFRRTFEADFFSVYKDQLPAIQEYEEAGYLTLTDMRLALTEAGIDCSNEIMAEFL